MKWPRAIARQWMQAMMNIWLRKGSEIVTLQELFVEIRKVMRGPAPEAGERQ